MTTKADITYDYKGAVEQILKELRRDRDRQIIARRFGFGMARRQTLEKIGPLVLEHVLESSRVRSLRARAQAMIAPPAVILREGAFH